MYTNLHDNLTAVPLFLCESALFEQYDSFVIPFHIIVVLATLEVAYNCKRGY